MAREVQYKGKSIEELKKMSLEELLEVIPARQRRSLKRGFTEQQKKLLEKIRKQKESGKPIRTQVRDMIILPEMVGVEFAIYSGKEYIQVTPDVTMIGHYFGEYALTRTKVAHSSPGLGATRGSKNVAQK